MFEKIFKQKSKEKKKLSLLKLEVIEINEIADMIFKRLEEKIETLKALEASVDEKIAILERLIQQAESLGTNLKQLSPEEQVVSLASNGLKVNEIANALNMPAGEVELILSLKNQK